MDYSLFCAENTRCEVLNFTTSDGVSLQVLDFVPAELAANQPMIFFMAGWISTIDGWVEVLKTLTQTHRVLYFESREKSSSQIPDVKKADFSVTRFSDDLAAAIQAYIPAEHPFILAGSSLGSTTILEYLLTDQRQPNGAWVISPNAEFRFPRALFHVLMALPTVLYVVMKPIIKWYIKTFRVDPVKEPEQWAKYSRTLDGLDPKKLQGNLKALDNYSLWGRLGAAQVPCEVVGATADKIHGVEAVERMVKELPNGQLFLMDSNKATHSSLAADRLLAFMRELS